MGDGMLFRYDYDRIADRGLSLQIYHDIRWWRFSVSPATYFDRRWSAHFMLTNFIGVLTMLIFGFNYWSLLLILIPAGTVYIHIPIYSKIDDCEYPEYGFYFYNEGRWMFDSFWLNLGWKNKCFHMPWEWDWVRTSVLLKDGKWDHDNKGNRIGCPAKEYYDKNRWGDVIRYETFPYRYKLKNGDVQERLATVSTQELEWRWRGFRWSPWPRLVRRTINVEFNDEVGERTGSWKGGTTGCGWRILPTETPRQALMNMEIYRKFE